MRLALGGVPLIVVALWSGAGRAQDQFLESQALVEKVVLMNKAALDDIDLLQWEGAKKRLLDALVVAKKGGLDNHPIMARTYVHLGVVYVMGFKSRDKGKQSFKRALEIDPGIRLSKGMASDSEVNDAFAEAGGRTSVPRPSLDCPVAAQTLVDQAVPVRCALTADAPVTKVFLLYREPVKRFKRRFTEVEMKRTPEGWFQGRIPERVIYGESLQFYFEGRNVAGKPIVKNGDEQSPKLIVILKR
jgi:hypothetical protein